MMTHLLALIMIMAAPSSDPIALLPPCPESPNCVFSQAADNHTIAAFPISGNGRAAFERLTKILRQRNDTTIIAADEGMLRVEFRTILGFVDDGLFLLDEGNKVIHIRSASRLGYWDLGKNRRRLEEIRHDYLGPE